MKKKSPAYTLILTVAAMVFAVLVIALVVINGRPSGEHDESSGTEPDLTVDFDVTTDAELWTETAEAYTSETETETETAETDEPAPEQTIPVGIYVKTASKLYSLTSEYTSAWPENDSDSAWSVDTWTYPGTKNLICDVAYFAVLASDESEIKLTYWDETWTERWDANVGDASAKIGFEFEVRLKDGGTATATVLSPADTFALEEYFELYLYDCVAHAHDSWYSHITEKTCYDDTKNVMIKITLRNGCYDVEEIAMTAFVYTSDELDENGNYTGANKFTCTVKRG